MTSHQVTIPRVLIPVLCPFLCPLKRNQTPDTNYCPTVACCCMLFELLHARRTTFPRPNQRERGGELHFLPNMVNHDQNISKHCFFPSFVFYSELTQQLATSLSFAAFSFQAFYNAMHSFKKRHTHTHISCFSQTSASFATPGAPRPGGQLHFLGPGRLLDQHGPRPSDRHLVRRPGGVATGREDT